jgi:hypothetical protein
LSMRDSTEATVFTKQEDANANGIFADLIGISGDGSLCPSNGASADLRQKFRAVINNVTYDFPTRRRIQMQKSSGVYTITITTTTP